MFAMQNLWKKPMNSLSYQQRIRHKLETTLEPVSLEVVDDSMRHQGHAGHDPRGETHFKITIVSRAFIGLSPVARHRLIYETLAEELQERVHALSIEAKAPDQ
jgi:BolA family transcriptional regulator, general stress-responsive regulator